MKSILISIKPQWVAKILKGEKTIEIRKTAPKCELPIDVYVYCTKTIKPVSRYDWGGFTFDDLPKLGKVVAKFTLRKVEEIKFRLLTKTNGYGYQRIEPTFTTQTLSFKELKASSRLTIEDLMAYLNDTDGYAWHIDDLEILDEPKELSEFYTLRCSQKKWPCNIKDVFGAEECHRICKLCKPLAKAPRSWQYAEIEAE